MALNEDEQTDAVFKSVRTEVDPVSGNEVPPGSLPEEVRDDIPAMLSEGEYVVPADVLRFYGVKFFEDLRRKAKDGLAKMEEDGRIGGEPIEDEEEQMDLPFSDEELETIEMDEGGLVGFVDGGLPEGTQVTGYGSDEFQLDPNDPTKVIMGGVGTGYELVTFYGPDGQQVNIPFFDGMPLASIPQGYTQNNPQETALEKAESDDRDPVDPALMKKVLGEKQEEKPINFNNPEDVRSAIDTYYSSGPMFKALGGVGLALDLGINKFEKSNLLKGIDKALAGDLDPNIKQNLEQQKGLLESRSKYKAKMEEEGEAFGFLDSVKKFFEGLKEGTTPEDIEKVKKKYNNSSSDAAASWQDATKLKNSLHPRDDPIAYHKAIKAQSEASRAFTALKKEEIAKKKAEQGDDYKPSGAPEPTTKYSKTVQDKEKEEE